MNTMNQTKVNVGLMSWLLSFVAGYADTSTFVCANRLFSAHVTGNFVLFVYSVLTNPKPSVWQNLLAFPVFVTAVIVSSLIVRHSRYPGKILRLEGLLLFLVGIAAMIARLTGMQENVFIFCLALIVVAAMGLQNAFGKLYPHTTYSVTTIMTGNVTQFTLELMQYLRAKNLLAGLAQSLRNQGLIIGSFFLGCTVGGVLSHFFGLSSIILPGIMVLYFWFARKKLILIGNDINAIKQQVQLSQ
jgi:uncharacterized membrane protein YoaK (UPF0700 family)